MQVSQLASADSQSSRY